MAHCPQCGTLSPDAAEVCAACGLILAVVHRPEHVFGRSSPTMLGVASKLEALAARLDRHDPEATLLTPPPDFDTDPGGPADPRTPEMATTAARRKQPVTPEPSSRTLLGVAPSELVEARSRTAAALDMAVPPKLVGQPLTPIEPSPPSHRTLLGVAHPGIAPQKPEAASVEPYAAPIEHAPTPAHYRPVDELGATYYSRNGHSLEVKVPPLVLDKGPGKRRKFARAIHMAPAKVPAPQGKPQNAKAFRRAWFALGAALAVLGSGALAALFWPSSPPLRVQVRPSESGGEVLEVTCPSCPDDTRILMDGSEARVTAGRAVLPLTKSPEIGETPIKISVDRPAPGRDEVVAVKVRVTYRIHPDLTTLQSDRPALQIVVDAEPGAKVRVDGAEVQLIDQKAVWSIDVSKDITGPTPNSETLERKISYEVHPPGGTLEKGVVSVSVASLPLVIDAPGPSVVTAQSSFVLSGRTLPGAELSVAGRAIEVQKDGSFARSMNVSSIGATQVKVHAKMAGKAPRIALIDVERVASLEVAAAEFEKKKSPIDYPTLVANPAAQSGKAIQLEGEVVDSKILEQHTVFILHVTRNCSSPPCPVRVDFGAPRKFATSDLVRVFGVVGQPSTSMPEVNAAFVLPSGKTRSAKKTEDSTHD